MNLNAHEQHCFDNAAHFVAVRGRIRSTRTRETFANFEDATKYGRTFADGKTMIYAVTEAGREAHIVNV